MCDMAKLKGKIAENGLNQMALAEAAGMDRSTLSRKMKNAEAFTIGEANRICKLFDFHGWAEKGKRDFEYDTARKRKKTDYNNRSARANREIRVETNTKKAWIFGAGVF